MAGPCWEGASPAGTFARSVNPTRARHPCLTAGEAGSRPVAKEPFRTGTPIAPTSRTLHLPVNPSPRIAPVTEYARAFALRMARQRAEVNAARRATRRAELRARAFELVAADRLTTGRA